MPLAIRHFENRDEAAVIALWNEALPANAPHNDPALTIRKKQQAGDGLFFVATVDGAVAGTVMGGYDGHRGWVYTVAVCANRRGHGVGTALMRHVERALSDLGCLKINLQVRTSNAEVVRFYRKLGYAVDDVLSMGKRLYVGGPSGAES
jgi:ribosomal protein S18 acetylase RimI-like enzyme